MIEGIPNYLPIWMLLAVGLGFLMGWACGDEYRRRIHAEDQVERTQRGVGRSQRADQTTLQHPF